MAEAARFLKIALHEVVVFHDELDLAFAKVRVKLGGGTAGHNGLRSIDACLGTRDFKRVRLGIGHPGDKERVLGHVLGDFAKAEHDTLDTFLDAVTDAAPHLAAGDDSAFMNRVAVLTQPPKPRPWPAACWPDRHDLAPTSWQAYIAPVPGTDPLEGCRSGRSGRSRKPL